MEKTENESSSKSRTKVQMKTESIKVRLAEDKMTSAANEKELKT